MKKIQMVDLRSQYEKIKEEVDAAMQEVIDQTAFINGPQVRLFADELKQYLNCKYVIPCGNGTDALQIAMMALDFKPGDEVIVPAFTYIAAVEVIALLGLKPVFVDVDPDTFQIDASKIEPLISDRTVAIVPVHLFGQCSNMESILKIAKKHTLKVIEDAAQSIGSVYTFTDGNRAFSGTMGDIGTTSFFPSKNLGCFGDGGALFTNDHDLAEKMRMISTHGQKKKYHHHSLGVNSRLDTIQAAMLRVKLRYLEQYQKARNEVASAYDLAFENHSHISIPKRDSNSTHVFHQYTVKLNGVNRENFSKHLASFGIPTMVYYPVPVHLQVAYQDYGFQEGDFPVAEKLSHEVISIPIHTEMDPGQLELIINTINSFFQ
ncbi:DegT/DnrJ/EryC1/StrS family aminotransferase [Aquiflexum gelatinilyticum]|uniref:DegT/DnrJ/EryC1/StrS family aminotransferase n=1 Tax=Aquiflexum gelatinilyticum TaxID=2961943 RepID=UPI00216A30C8|nr:DegT/DnrJ/EryC1/StrS family aminotransferase [Aquiflexum gelatinilyticum]MCS4434475.1 DegT/DnrJ/EryC1/StrS family aminotransferase [Aquiflexum gelatinilyticum]